MLVGFDLFKTSLRRPMRPADNILCMNSRSVQRLINRIGVGNHTYLTIQYGNMCEVVRVDIMATQEHMLNPSELPVIRDVQHTGRKTFASGACVQFIWVEEAIKELSREVQS